jgi:hypothetical protein
MGQPQEDVIEEIIAAKAAANQASQEAAKAPQPEKKED